FSFFTAISAKLMMIAFSPMNRSSDGSRKDTPRNILREKDFVINIASFYIAETINLCSTELPYGEDEFSFAGVTPLKSECVKAMRIKESKVHFECLYRDHLAYGEGAGGGMIITGEVVKVHLSEDIFDQGRIVTSKLDPVGR